MTTPIIIAEAGVNHNGSLERALRMVDAAAESGADYIKFQTFKAESLVTASADAADYQRANCGAPSQLEMLRSLELSYDDFIRIAEYSRKRGIGFLSTPFDIEGIGFLVSIGMDFMKIPSGEITNLPYLRAVAKTGLPVILSTGMSTVADIEKALDVFRRERYGSDRIILLHCNTEYPTPMRDVNLQAMLTMRDIFNVPTGYSDHTAGIEIPVAAAALGAVVIEKHFTLSRSLPGPDHAASLEPDELSRMVGYIRNVSEALGSGVKDVSPSEKKNIAVARKSIVVSRNIAEGELFSEENLTCKRPGDGVSPMLWDDVIGRPANHSYKKDQQIEL